MVPRLVRPVLAVALALVLLPVVAAAIDCPTLALPRPAEEPATIRARLEAEGRWRPAKAPALTPPADPQVGDTWLWYVWDLGGFPVANLKPATVRGLGEHCYVVVDDDEWNVTMDQADVDRIVEHFDAASVGEFPDQGIWDLNTSHFGAPPNPLDGLDRIFLFYYRFDIAADGFFWVYDQFPDGSQPFASNECDVVYLATDSGQPGSDYMLAVAAHEFQHMIHYNHDANEASWVEEGLGELAMWLFGRPDTISGFNAQPDNSLLAWNSAWADYIKTYLWTLYVYEQYGGQPTIRAVVEEPANSLAGYQAALLAGGYAEQTSDVLRDWTVANYLDDPTVPDGRFGYQGDDLPPFTAFRTHASYPVAAQAGNVQAYAADYVRLQNLAAPPVITFNGQDARLFRVMLMARDASLPTLVEQMTLDAAQDGTHEFAAAAGYDEVILTIASVSTTGTASYTYGVEESSLTAVDDVLAARPGLGAQPNPFNPRTEFSFNLARESEVRLTVHDPRGREVAALVAGRLPAGRHAVPWRADDVAAGVYVGRLTVDGAPAAAVKATVVK